MVTVVIVALAALLIGGAVAAGIFLLRGPRTDSPPRPEGLTPETRKRLSEMAKRCDLGREIVGDLAQVDGSALWPAYQDRITDRAQKRCLAENLDGCLSKKSPLRRKYSSSEYREDTASLPTPRSEALPFKPLSVHNTIKTLYIRFYLEDHNAELLAPPVYTPMVLNLEQQAAYLEQVRPLMSQASGILQQVKEASDEDILKVVYAAWSMRRPNKEMREAAEILFPGHPGDHFFLSVALRQWFLLLQRTLTEYLSWLVEDYDCRRRGLVNQVRALEALRKALEKRNPAPPAGFRVIYHYRVTKGGHTEECDALVLSTTGIYPVEAKYFGGEEAFSADAAASPGLVRAVFLWDYFSPVLEKMAPGKGSSLIHPILSVAGKAPFQHASPCSILRPESVRELITSRTDVFTEEQVDELFKIFRSQGERPSAQALPDYAAAMEQLDRGILKEFRRVRKTAESLPHRTYQKKAK